MDKDIKQLRNEIDEIDKQIADLLNKRFNIAVKIGKIKKANSIAVLDENREKIVIDNFVSLFSHDKKQCAKDVLLAILKSSKELQK